MASPPLSPTSSSSSASSVSSSSSRLYDEPLLASSWNNMPSKERDGSDSPSTKLSAWKYLPALALAGRRRRFLAAVVASLTIAVLLALQGYLVRNADLEAVHGDSDNSRTLQKQWPSAVLGPPTVHFRDNLRNDTKYITSWPSAGWTNDVIAYGNLIYLAQITNRTPILTHFVPAHIGPEAPPLPFGDVFNMSYLREHTGLDAVEWRDVKEYVNVNKEGEFHGNGEGEEAKVKVDPLGCWNIWEVSQYDEASPRFTYATGHIGLDLSYTRAPTSLKKVQGNGADKCVTFWSAATLAFPETRDTYLNINLNVPGMMTPSKVHGHSLPPDDQIFCLDYLYYVCAANDLDFDMDYSPAWRYSMQYMRWTDRLEHIAATEIRRSLNTSENEDIPPYISIHVRHLDFGNYCGGYSIDECFAPLDAIRRRVEEVREEVWEKKGVFVNEVIMTSDERNETWWGDVKALGWRRIDHERTYKLYGRWYPVLVDAVIQSNGLGFVGTDLSTMSVVAQRRVETWHGGASRLVRWGRPGADDH